MIPNISPYGSRLSLPEFSTSESHGVLQNETTVSAKLNPVGRLSPLTIMISTESHQGDNPSKIEELQTRIRPGSPGVTMPEMITPWFTETKALSEPPFSIESAIQIGDYGFDLSLLRYYRDHLHLIDPLKMANVCLKLEALALSGNKGYNRKKIGDFFRIAMAVMPEFRERMRTCKVLLTDVNDPQKPVIEKYTNATTLLNDYIELSNMMEDIRCDFEQDLEVPIIDDPHYAIPAIRYLETGDESELTALDPYELSFMASKWQSSKLQGYCKKKLEGQISEINNQFKERLRHLCRLQDSMLDFIFLPMAAKVITNSRKTLWKKFFEELSKSEIRRINKGYLKHLKRSETGSRREEHPDRVRYSLELIEYFNLSQTADHLTQRFYATPTDLLESLRILFHAAIYDDKNLDQDKAHGVVKELISHILCKSDLIKSDQIYDKIIAWCCVFCNHAKPNLPYEIVNSGGWHGKSLCFALDDLSSDQIDVHEISDKFAENALKSGIQELGAVRVVWLLRPSTRFASEGILTVCTFDHQTGNYDRFRIQFFEGLYFRLYTNKEAHKTERKGKGRKSIEKLVIASIRSKYHVQSSREIKLICRPLNEQEREQQYSYINL